MTYEPQGKQSIGIGWDDLTERERAVAVLAGRALTNQQIAHRLFISPHTVNFHLRRIFRKLAIDSRVSLARLIIQDQPLDPGPTGQVEPPAAA